MSNSRKHALASLMLAVFLTVAHGDVRADALYPKSRAAEAVEETLNGQRATSNGVRALLSREAESQLNRRRLDRVCSFMLPGANNVDSSVWPVLQDFALSAWTWLIIDRRWLWCLVGVVGVAWLGGRLCWGRPVSWK